MNRRSILIATWVVALFCCLPVYGQDQAASQESTSQESTSQESTSQESTSQESTSQKSTSQESKGEPAVGEKVLRHAVYLAFQESASESDIAGVVDAFAALEDEIPSIIGFETGTNNSPEKLDDGFTHCFLVTFADEKGLQSYLPHPGHLGLVSKATPFAANMFVMDYFGQQDESDKRQLRHAVYFKFKDDATPEQIAEVERAFAALESKIDAIKGFEMGTNLKPGRYDHGFTHCFLLTFDSEEGRAAYLPHPDHKAFGQLLRPVLDKVRVLDYWTGESP